MYCTNFHKHAFGLTNNKGSVIISHPIAVLNIDAILCKRENTTIKRLRVQLPTSVDWMKNILDFIISWTNIKTEHKRLMRYHRGNPQIHNMILSWRKLPGVGEFGIMSHPGTHILTLRSLPPNFRYYVL